VIKRRHIQSYCDPRPDSKIGKVRTKLMYLMDQHCRDDALPTSVRFLFYELVAQRIIAKSGERPDKIVSAALTDLRERGLVRWEDIVDETREVSDFTGPASVAKDWLDYLASACIDPWRGQVPFILTESRSLAGVIRDMCCDYRNRLAATNGLVGGFLHTDVAPLLKEGDRVGYLGDYDLAGNDIEANTRRVLEELVGPLNWTRLALTREQVDEYQLPSIDKIDKRFNGRGGHAQSGRDRGAVTDRDHRHRAQLAGRLAAGLAAGGTCPRTARTPAFAAADRTTFLKDIPQRRGRQLPRHQPNRRTSNEP
jgi:hypothetical protein